MPGLLRRWRPLGRLLLVAGLLLAPRAAANAAEGQALPMSLLQLPATPVGSSHLSISWPRQLKDPDSAKAKDSAKLIAAACATLGKAFLVGQGAWGSGLFDSFDCTAARGKKLIAGSPPRTQAGDQWTLTLSVKGSELSLAMAYKASQQTFAVVTAPVSRWTVDLLRDPVYAGLLAASVMDKLPMAFRFAAPQQKNNRPSAEAHAFNETGLADDGRPKNLVLFTLQQDSRGAWRPQIVGSAKLSKPKKGLRSWQLTLTQALDAKATLYGQRAEGPEQSGDTLDDLRDKRGDGLLRDPSTPGYRELREGLTKAVRFVFLDNVAAGYIGLRYGMEQRPKSTAVLPPATVFGLIAEFRGGIAEGLRIYYDLVPRKSSAVDDEQLHLGWQRLVFGYGFGLDLPWFINRIEVAPKLGIWSVDSRMPYVSDSGDVVFSDFRMSNAPSIGFEACVEIERSAYLVRFWHGRDFSSTLFSKASIRREVNSMRTGIDAVLKGPKLPFIGKAWHLGILLFGFYEDISFRTTDKTNQSYSLDDSTAFVGGGLSLSW